MSRCLLCKIKNKEEGKDTELIFPIDRKQPRGIVRRPDFNSSCMESHIKVIVFRYMNQE